MVQAAAVNTAVWTFHNHLEAAVSNLQKLHALSGVTVTCRLLPLSTEKFKNKRMVIMSIAQALIYFFLIYDTESHAYHIPFWSGFCFVTQFLSNLHIVQPGPELTM